MYSIGPNRPLRCSIDAVPWIFTATGSMGSTEARLSTMSETLSLARGDVLVLARSGQVLVAPDQDVVSVELEADDVGIGLPGRRYGGEPGEALRARGTPVPFP